MELNDIYFGSLYGVFIIFPFPLPSAATTTSIPSFLPLLSSSSFLEKYRISVKHCLSALMPAVAEGWIRLEPETQWSFQTCSKNHYLLPARVHISRKVEWTTASVWIQGLQSGGGECPGSTLAARPNAWPLRTFLRPYKCVFGMVHHNLRSVSFVSPSSWLDPLQCRASPDLVCLFIHSFIYFADNSLKEQC